MRQIAIKAEGLSKQYEVGTGTTRHDTLRDHLASVVKPAFRKTRRTASETRHIWALKDFSFEVRHGEVVGIIGHNGAGKSTLLKLLSRITPPTEGQAVIRGRLGSLLEVGTGFHHELTGRENVYLSGAILGMTKKEIDAKFDEIVSFAEIGDFMDTPVKRYSSGMYVRLAYAVTAHLNPDILLVDEVLSVGDLAFQRKCMEHAKGLQRRSATVLIVSHNMYAIRETCTRAIYLSKGRGVLDGTPEECIELYEKESRLDSLSSERPSDRAALEDSIRIYGMSLHDEDGNPTRFFNYGDRMRVKLNYEISQPVSNPNFVVAFVRSDNVACCNYSTATDGFQIPTDLTRGTVELLTPPLKLVAEMYVIYLLIWDQTFTRLYTSARAGMTFHVRHELLSTHFGVYHESAEWSFMESVRSDQLERQREEVGLLQGR
jgi:lipopolysaccharide transport system ATP-binding protein